MATFPEQFAALEPYAGWALQSERDSYAKRLDSSIDELQEFYDAAFALIVQAREHLQSVPYDKNMSDEDKHLMWLYCALSTVSFPVEVWRQPRVPDSGASTLDAVVEPAL
jgi:hypothetical protein